MTTIDSVFAREILDEASVAVTPGLDFDPDRGAGTVLTIHNLGYQGSFGRETIDDLGLAPWSHLFDQDDLRVTAGDDQRQEWRGEQRGVGRQRRPDVSLEMVDGEERAAAGKGQRLGEADADQERAEQARAVRDRHAAEIGDGERAGRLRGHGRDDELHHGVERDGPDPPLAAVAAVEIGEGQRPVARLVGDAAALGRADGLVLVEKPPIALEALVGDEPWDTVDDRELVTVARAAEPAVDRPIQSTPALGADKIELNSHHPPFRGTGECDRR